MIHNISSSNQVGVQLTELGVTELQNLYDYIYLKLQQPGIRTTEAVSLSGVPRPKKQFVEVDEEGYTWIRFHQMLWLYQKCGSNLAFNADRMRIETGVVV